MSYIKNVPSVNGSNLKETIDQIDKNFRTLCSDGVFKGDPGEGYMSKTLQLWSVDDGVITIHNEDVLKTIFGDNVWGKVKDWTVADFEMLDIPKEWTLYPGNPLWYVQNPSSYNLFLSMIGEGADYSCMVAVDGGFSDGNYIYKRYDIVPQLYREESTGNYCWKINGVKTGISASNNPDINGVRNVRFYLIKNTGTDDAPSYLYLTSVDGAVEWRDKADIDPVVGDFAWELSRETVSVSGVDQTASVLKVCMYNGYKWSPATADPDNKNYFLSYDDAMMAYVWGEVYGGLGDTKVNENAAENKSICFPVRGINDVATGESHKITSKTNVDESSQDYGRKTLLIESPKGGNSDITISGYNGVYLKNYSTYGSPNEMNRLMTFGEERVIPIDIKDAINLDETNAVDGALYKIDRCYWKNDAQGYTENVLKTTGVERCSNETPYIRYVYVRCHITTGDTLNWETSGVGELSLDSDIYPKIYRVNFVFPGAGMTNKYIQYSRYDRNVYFGNADQNTAIESSKFGVITWMRDDVYCNECDWDFIMHNTFLITTDDISTDNNRTSHIYDDWQYFYDRESSYQVQFHNYVMMGTIEGIKDRVVAPFRNNRITSFVGDNIDADYNVHYNAIPYNNNVIDRYPNQDFTDTARIITVLSESEDNYLDAQVFNNVIESCENVIIIHDNYSETGKFCNNHITNSKIAIFTERFVSNTIKNSVVILGDSMSLVQDEDDLHHDPRQNDKYSFYMPCDFAYTIINNSVFRGIYYTYINKVTVIKDQPLASNKVKGIWIYKQDSTSGVITNKPNVQSVYCHKCEINNLNITNQSLYFSSEIEDFDMSSLSILNTRDDGGSAAYLIIVGDQDNVRNGQCMLHNINVHGDDLSKRAGQTARTQLLVKLLYTANYLDILSNSYVIGVFMKTNTYTDVINGVYVYSNMDEISLFPTISCICMAPKVIPSSMEKTINSYTVDVCSGGLTKNLYSMIQS